MISVRALRRTAAAFAIVACASTASAQSISSSSSSSSSSVSSGPTVVSVTDGRSSISPGGNLIYIMTVQQNSVAQKNVTATLLLPAYVNIASPDNGGIVVGNLVQWSNIPLSQNQPKTLTVNVSILSTAPEGTVLTATASAENAQATDTTIVQTGLAGGNFTASITDNRNSALPGDTLTYNITVRNNSPYQQRTDIVATASDLTSVTSANPTAQVSFPKVSWMDVTFAPNEQKIFSFNADIRKRLTAYTGVYASVKAGTVTATDTTLVNSTNNQNSTSSSSSRRSSSSSSRATQAPKNVLFRNVADASEVVPGGTVRYTLFVQNVLLNTIGDATITNRFDPSQLSVEDAGGGTKTADGVLQWKLPTLQPGQTWRATYTLRVNRALGTGTQLDNVATISGNDVAFATLNERVTVNRIGVVTTLPATGFSSELFFIVAAIALSAAAAITQKKAI